MLKVSGKHIALSLLVYSIILIARPGYFLLLLILASLSLITSVGAAALYNKKVRPLQILKSVTTMVVIVTIIYLIAYWLGPYGFYSTLVIILGLSAWRILKNRKAFIKGLRDIETMLWGRPLDRSAWNGKRPPRLKFVLHKKGSNLEGGKMKRRIKRTRHVPQWLAWISLIGFILVGALAIVENIIGAMFVLHNGGSAVTFAGYLVGVLVMAMIVWFVPIVIMAKYIKHLRVIGVQ